MKIYLIDQRKNASKHIDFLKEQKVKYYDKNKLIEKTTSIEINSSKSLEHLNLDFFFNYHIFPENILTFKTQWENENRKIQVGDTIMQQAYLPPVKLFSQKIIFGLRINDVTKDKSRMGFSYETLEGHIEVGVSSFTIEEVNNKLVFKIHTYSAPGNFLSKLVGPIISVPYQTFCTKSALRNVKRQIELQ